MFHRVQLAAMHALPPWHGAHNLHHLVLLGAEWKSSLNGVRIIIHWVCSTPLTALYSRINEEQSDDWVFVWDVVFNTLSWFQRFALCWGKLLMLLNRWRDEWESCLRVALALGMSRVPRCLPERGLRGVLSNKSNVPPWHGHHSNNLRADYRF